MTRPSERTPWQPLRYLTLFGTVDDCRHYAAKHKALIALETTQAIARIIEGLADVPPPPRSEGDEETEDD